MKSKNIWHVGGYTRNYGDFVLLESMREYLRNISDVPLNFVSVDCQNTHFFTELIDELNEKADMLIIGGGGLVMNRHEDNSLSGWQFSIKNEDIERIKIPIVVYGIGYNKFMYDNRGFKLQMNESLRLIQEKSRLFSVRNSGTKEELVSRGLNPDKITVIPDPGMFISPRKIDIPVLDSNRFLVGLNFVSDRPHYTYPESCDESKKEILTNLIITCKYLIKKYNALIVNIDHIPILDEKTNDMFKSELKDNYLVLSEICSQIYPPSLVNSHFLAYVYEKMDIVIGMRGHSNIISFGMSTKFLSLGSHNKNRFFLKDVGEEEYLIDIRDYKNTATSDAIIQKVEMLIDDKNYVNRVALKRDELFKEFNDFNVKIVDILRENKMEILDLYDDNCNLINETIIRGNKPDIGKNIMLSVAFIVNSRGEYLIQKTSKLKGSKYSSTGGHVTHGENGITTIIRELKEELDITTSQDEIKYITTFKYPTKQCVFNVYLLEIDNLDTGNIQLQVEEVESIEWMSKDSVLQLIANNCFLESHAHIFNNYIVNQ